jgi:pimeloyl-ACP methyl ester carboxylesterase
MSKTPTDAHIPSDLRMIGSPTLVIWGERDNLIPLSVGERLSNDLPQSHLAIVEGAGHNPYLDRAEVVTKLVVDFLLDQKD